jgi:transposase-like protein
MPATSGWLPLVRCVAVPFNGEAKGERIAEGLIPREDEEMPAPRRYPQELRDRAQRLVREAREEDPGLSLNQAVIRVGQRVGVNADTLRGWCKQADIDAGSALGRRPRMRRRSRILSRRFVS